MSTITETPVLLPVPTTQDPEVARILEDAAELLEREGWVPHCPRYWNHGPACTAVAIQRACGMNDDLYEEVAVQFTKFLHLAVPSTGSVVAWNDRQTDIRVVTRALREAAASS